MSLKAESGEKRDTSCAALVAYGLSLLEGNTDPIKKLRALGERILDSLVDHYLITQDDERRGMLLHGCYSKPKEYATDNELIWSTYYLAFALDAYLKG